MYFYLPYNASHTDWYSSMSTPTTDSSSWITLPVLCLLLHCPVHMSSSHQAMVPVTAKLVFPLLSTGSSCICHCASIHHHSNVRTFFILVAHPQHYLHYNTSDFYLIVLLEVINIRSYCQ